MPAGRKSSSGFEFEPSSFGRAARFAGLSYGLWGFPFLLLLVVVLCSPLLLLLLRSIIGMPFQPTPLLYSEKQIKAPSHASVHGWSLASFGDFRAGIDRCWWFLAYWEWDSHLYTTSSTLLPPDSYSFHSIPWNRSLISSSSSFYLQAGRQAGSCTYMLFLVLPCIYPLSHHLSSCSRLVDPECHACCTHFHFLLSS